MKDPAKWKRERERKGGTTIALLELICSSTTIRYMYTWGWHKVDGTPQEKEKSRREREKNLTGRLYTYNIHGAEPFSFSFKLK